LRCERIFFKMAVFFQNFWKPLKIGIYCSTNVIIIPLWIAHRKCHFRHLPINSKIKTSRRKERIWYAIITVKLLQIDGRDENADYIFIVSLKFSSFLSPLLQSFRFAQLFFLSPFFIAFKAFLQTNIHPLTQSLKTIEWENELKEPTWVEMIWVELKWVK